MQDSSSQQHTEHIIASLYQSETARLTAILLKLLGAQHLSLVQDLVQDTFAKALLTWKKSGIPENPPAWLIVTAKNAAKDALRSQEVKKRYADSLEPELLSNWTLPHILDAQFSSLLDIEDAQLNMLVWLSTSELEESYLLPVLLRLVCGLSVSAVSRALLISETNTKKRLLRSQDKLSKHHFVDSIEEVNTAHVTKVHACLYLLFNAGLSLHHHKSKEESLLLIEAINLTEGLLKVIPKNQVQSESLLALMYLYLARQSSRYDKQGNIISLPKQDRRLWRNQYLVKGSMLLSKVLDTIAHAHQFRLSTYELYSAYLYEALVANEHLRASNFAETDYHQISEYYRQWYQHSESPLIAINLCIAKAHTGEFEASLNLLDALRRHKQLQHSFQIDAALSYVFALNNKHQLAIQHAIAAQEKGMDNKEYEVLQAHLIDCRQASVSSTNS